MVKESNCVVDTSDQLHAPARPWGGMGHDSMASGQVKPNSSNPRMCLERQFERGCLIGVGCAAGEEFRRGSNSGAPDRRYFFPSIYEAKCWQLERGVLVDDWKLRTTPPWFWEESRF